LNYGKCYCLCSEGVKSTSLTSKGDRLFNRNCQNNKPINLKEFKKWAGWLQKGDKLLYYCGFRNFFTFKEYRNEKIELIYFPI